MISTLRKVFSHRFLMSTTFLFFIHCWSTLWSTEPPNYTPLTPTGTIRPFMDGDKIDFLGDSITREGKFQKYIYTYWVTRHSDVKIICRNKGIASDCVPWGILRLDFDVLKEKPNIVAIGYGMNDSGASWRTDLYGLEKPGADILVKREALIHDFRKNTEQLLCLLKAQNITPILLGPSIYDDTMDRLKLTLFNSNSSLVACSEELKELSSKNDLEFVDFNQPMLLANEILQKTDPHATIVGADRVHPDAPGHWLMAYCFLKAQKVTPYVAAFEINAGQCTAINLVNCSITNLKVSGKVLSFEYFPKALPLPVNEEYRQAETIVPITKAFNQEVFQITSLPEGKYQVTMDAAQLGYYSATELAAGINIAPNPENAGQKQSQAVDGLIQERYKIEYAIRMVRQIDIGYAKRFMNGERAQVIDEFKTELVSAKQNKEYAKSHDLETYLKNVVQEESMNQQIVDLERQIYQSARPIKHLVKVTELSF